VPAEGSAGTTRVVSTVNERSAPDQRIHVATQTREEADVLLARLLSDRRLSEQRYAAAGKSDPMKRLTGASALDRAIVSTRQMITHMDDLVRELQANLPEPLDGLNGSGGEPPVAAPLVGTLPASAGGP
jgi:hypothetical protein